MKVYAPKFKPGDVVGYKRTRPLGISFIVTTVKGSILYDNYEGWRYQLDSVLIEGEILEEDLIYPIPVAYTNFEV